MRPAVGSITAPRHLSSVLLPDGRADQAHHFARRDLHIHVSQGKDSGVTIAIPLAQTFDAYALPLISTSNGFGRIDLECHANGDEAS
jgi:hypothetical protein